MYTDPRGQIISDDLRPLPEGQAAPGSIFHVPSQLLPLAEELQKPITSARELFQASQAYGFNRHGYRREILGLDFSFDSKRKDKGPSLPTPETSDQSSPYQTFEGNIYRTTCAYCWATVCRHNWQEPFTLHQIRNSGLQGCETYTILQGAIVYFTNLLILDYDEGKVRIIQSENEPTRLLS